MNAKKLEELEDKVSRQWAWRLREIDAYKKILAGSTAQAKDLELLCRLGIVLLYSHWEGFIKSSASLYMESFVGEPIKNAPMNIKIANFIKAHDCYRAKYTAYQCGYTVLNDINDEGTIRRDIAEMVSTESNLNATVLEKISSFLGLGKEWFELRSKFINNFVDCRHAIAHGEGRRINKTDIDQYISGILELIRKYKDKLLEM